MSLESCFRQSHIEDYFPQSKSTKSEAVLLPKLENLSGINLISAETVASLLKNEITVEKFLILDTRFDYEYEGGHIANARHSDSREKVLELLQGKNWENSPIIIHCEFSQLRGPAMVKWLRNYDRTQNCENYPMLNYPELYLMQGGYSEFFNVFPHLCVPNAYVPCNLRKSKKALSHIKKTSKQFE